MVKFLLLIPKFIKLLFQNPFFRHIFFALLIGWIVYGYGQRGKAELKGQLKANKELIEQLQLDIDACIEQPKTQTIIKHVKIKDDASLNLSNPIKPIVREFKRVEIDSISNIDTITPTQQKNLSKRQKRRLKRLLKKRNRKLKRLNKKINRLLGDN